MPPPEASRCGVVDDFLDPHKGNIYGTISPEDFAVPPETGRCGVVNDFLDPHKGDICGTTQEEV